MLESLESKRFVTLDQTLNRTFKKKFTKIKFNYVFIVKIKAYRNVTLKA